jgi:hypothetical protein
LKDRENIEEKSVEMWKNIKNMEDGGEKLVEMWNDVENLEEKYVE